LEARIQASVRQAIAATGAPPTQLMHVKSSPSHVSLLVGPDGWSTTTLEKAEASHLTEGLRILEARRAQETLAKEEAKSVAEKSRILQAELQAELHELATAD